jgi:hypothetical protein
MISTGFTRRVLAATALAALALLQNACSSSEIEVDDSDEIPSDPDAPNPIFPGVLARGCDWALIYDPSRPGGNSAFPDKGARYWIAVVAGAVPQGSRLRMEGQYPDARYHSLQLYNGQLASIASLSDYQIVPDPGSDNTFLDQTRRSGADYGGDYTAYVRIGENAPAVPEQNTMYRPPQLTGGHVIRRSVIAYRTYLPDGGNQGRVELPKLTLETPDGEELPLTNDTDAETCAQIAANLRQDGARLTGSANLLDPIAPSPLPQFKKFDGAVGTGAGGQGVGFNRDNGFMYAKTQVAYAPILLVRGRSASFTTQPGAGNPPQVRYWSICDAGFNTQMVYNCTTDENTALDEFGYYTVVVTTDSSRPSSVDAAPGYTWLPRGPENIGVITMRELLAHPSFAQATVNIPTLVPPATVKGEYMPLATYCSTAVFEGAASQGPAAAFAACDSSRRVLP